MMVDAVLDAAEQAGNRRLVVRATLTGRTSLHRAFSVETSGDDYLNNLMDSFGDDLGRHIVAGVNAQVRPALNREALMQGDSLLGTSLRRLRDMGDEEVLGRFRNSVAAAYQKHLEPMPSPDEARALIEQALIAAMED